MRCKREREREALSLESIIRHLKAEMQTRRTLGFAQHDNHVWRWLNYKLAMWLDGA